MNDLIKFHSKSESSQKAAESELGAVTVPEWSVLLDKTVLLYPC